LLPDSPIAGHLLFELFLHIRNQTEQFFALTLGVLTFFDEYMDMDSDCAFDQLFFVASAPALLLFVQTRQLQLQLVKAVVALFQYQLLFALQTFPDAQNRGKWKSKRHN